MIDSLRSAPSADDAFSTSRAKARGGVRITLAVEIWRQRIEHLRPDLLREGMVLTRDVLGDRGALLVARGTRLSQVNAERLARLVPEHSLVQVSIAA